MTNLSIVRMPAWIVNIGAALIITFIFAPWLWYPLSIIALAIAFSSWIKQTPKSALLTGGLFGIVYATASSYWVYYSLHDFGEAPVAFAILLALLLALVISLFFAATACFVSYCRRQPIASLCLLIFPATWVLMEWVRSSLLTGFPWNLLGQSLVGSPWQGVLPLFGVLGGSAVVVLCAGCIVYFFHTTSYARLIPASIMILILGVVAPLKEISWTEETPERLSVAIIQANIPQKIKFDRVYFEKLVDKYTQLTERHIDSDLIIWPETAIPVYADMMKQRFARLNEKLAQNNTELLTGIFHRNQSESISHNSVMNIVSGDFYHKRRLVPFGEFMPMRPLLELFDRFIIIPMSDLQPSDMKPVIATSDYTAGVSICYEAAFSNDVADSLPEADFLINVSNDSWFGDSLAPYQMLQMAQVRAAETERYMARVTNTGISAAIDYRGRIMEASELFETAVIRAELTIRRGVTPYVQWRDYPLLAWILISLISAGILALRLRNSRMQ